MRRGFTLPGRFRSTCFWILILILFFGVSLRILVRPAEGLERVAIAPVDAYLVLDGRSLGLATHGIERAEQSNVVYEWGFWNQGRGSVPGARLFLAKIADHVPKRFVFVEKGTLEDAVKTWFEGVELSIGERRLATNAVGDLEYVQFTRPGPYACVGMRQYAATYTGLAEYTSKTFEKVKGNIHVEGYYCEPISISAETVMRFLGAIGIRGYALPESGEVALAAGTDGLTCGRTLAGESRVTTSSRSVNSQLPIRVAIFPLGRGVNSASGGSSANFESEMLDRVSALVRKSDSLELVYLTAAHECQIPEIENNPTRFWTGAVDKIPVEDKVYAAAENLDADVIVLLSWRAVMANVRISLYLLDLNQRKMYKGSVTSEHTNYQNAVEKLAEEMFALQSPSARM